MPMPLFNLKVRGQTVRRLLLKLCPWGGAGKNTRGRRLRVELCLNESVTIYSSMHITVILQLDFSQPKQTDNCWMGSFFSPVGSKGSFFWKGKPKLHLAQGTAIGWHETETLCLVLPGICATAKKMDTGASRCWKITRFISADTLPHSDKLLPQLCKSWHEPLFDLKGSPADFLYVSDSCLYTLSPPTQLHACSMILPYQMLHEWMWSLCSHTHMYIQKC